MASKRISTPSILGGGAVGEENFIEPRNSGGSVSCLEIQPCWVGSVDCLRWNWRRLASLLEPYEVTGARLVFATR